MLARMVILAMTIERSVCEGTRDGGSDFGFHHQELQLIFGGYNGSKHVLSRELYYTKKMLGLE